MHGFPKRSASRLLRSQALHALSALQHTFDKRSLRKGFSILLFACTSLMLMGNQSCTTSDFNAFATTMMHINDLLKVHATPARAVGGNPLPRALLTGSDGSQTGTAAIQGNFTGIQVPSGAVFAMAREADCSLGLVTVTSSSDPGTVTEHYERTLHQLAGLKTVAGVYPKGCVEPNTGLSSRPGVFVGRTTGGVLAFADAGANTNANAVFTYTSTNGLTVATDTSLPSASALAVGDFNGDGNNDLVVVNGYAASSAFVSVKLANADGTFGSAVAYPTGGSSAAAAVVDDVNGDGKQDIVVMSSVQTAGQQQMSVLLGKGDGTFQSAQTIAVPALPGYSGTQSTAIVNMITADVNGDGKKDIIGSNGLVLLGNGDGTFTAATTAAFPPLTAFGIDGINLASGDLNNDGKLDLVVSTGASIAVWLGKGDGTFTQGSSYASINDSGFLTVTDLDGDGNADIYVGLANGGVFSGDDISNTSAYALMGNGDGTFVGAPYAPAAYNGSNLGDLNNDGYPDLITPTTGTVNGNTAVFTVSLGSAKGVFVPDSTITAPPTVTVTVSEFTSPVTVNTTNLPPSSYAIGDVNGDGHADVVYVANNGGYSVLFVALGNGDGTFAVATATGFPQIAPASGYDNSTTVGNLRIQDFTHDGKADVLFNYYDTQGPTGLYTEGFGVLPSNGDGTFGSPKLTSTYSSTTAPNTSYLPAVSAIADVNTDGLPDLVATNQTFSLSNGVGVTTSTVQIFLGKSDGTFASPTTAMTTTYLGQVTVADFNKDGKLDIAALTETSSAQAQLAMALGNGDGTFGTSVTSNLLGGDAIRGSGLVSADFDADGNIDLALLDGNDFSGFFYGKGDGTFTSVPFNGNIVPKDLISLDSGGQSIAVDLNKDGKPDILSGQTILLNQFGSAPVVITAAPSTTVLSASASSIAPGASLTLTATVTSSTGTPDGTVTFFDGNNPLGTGTLDGTGKATFATSSLTTVGGHNLTASYGGSSSFQGSLSSIVVVTVATAAPVATTTTLSATANSAVVGTSITFTANVNATTGTPTGSVNFFDGATQLGSGTLDGTGKATYATSTLSAGSHSVTAVYVPTGNFSTSTSTALSINITAAVTPDFSLALSPTSATVTHGSSTSTTLTLTPLAGYKTATTFTCGSLPTNATCSVTPSSVTPDGSTATTATVNIGTGTVSAKIRSAKAMEYSSVALIGIFVLAGLASRRRLPALLVLMLSAIAALGLSGCGGKSSATSTGSTTPLGSYTITITATGGSVNHSANFTLTVQ